MNKFLRCFASPEHQSFCFITSRVPVLDLIDFTTYSHHNINRLMTDDGVTLMKKIGVKGKKNKIAEIVDQWGGHALTLSLLAAYLVEHHGGKIAHVDSVAAPTENEPAYEGIDRILRQYDGQLSDEARAFLIIFSAFRIPIAESVFNKVFRTKIDQDALNYPLAQLNKIELRDLINRLINLQLIRFDDQTREYSAHILIRNYYSKILNNASTAQLRKLNTDIAKYYFIRVDKSAIMRTGLVGPTAGRGAAQFAKFGVLGAIGGALAYGGIAFALSGGVRALLGFDQFLPEAFYHAKLAGMKIYEGWQEND